MPTAPTSTTCRCSPCPTRCPSSPSPAGSSHHTFTEHYATLRGALDLHRRCWRRSLREGGAGVLATVHRAMPRRGPARRSTSPAASSGAPIPPAWRRTRAGAVEGGPRVHGRRGRTACGDSARVRLGADVEAVVVAGHRLPPPRARGAAVRAGPRRGLPRAVPRAVGTRGDAGAGRRAPRGGRSRAGARPASVEHALDRLGAASGRAAYRVLADRPPRGRERRAPVLGRRGRAAARSADRWSAASTVSSTRWSPTDGRRRRAGRRLRCVARLVTGPRIGRSRAKSDLVALRQPSGRPRRPGLDVLDPGARRRPARPPGLLAGMPTTWAPPTSWRRSSVRCSRTTSGSPGTWSTACARTWPTAAARVRPRRSCASTGTRWLPPRPHPRAHRVATHAPGSTCWPSPSRSSCTTRGAGPRP
jgi:hypothetical protein